MTHGDVARAGTGVDAAGLAAEDPGDASDSLSTANPDPSHVACGVTDPPEAAAAEDLALLACTRTWVRDPDPDPDPPVAVDALGPRMGRGARRGVSSRCGDVSPSNWRCMLLPGARSRANLRA